MEPSWHNLYKIPRTPELRSVVEAMNKMSRSLKIMNEEDEYLIEKMRSQSSQDSLTGLGNRQYFYSQLEFFTQTKTLNSTGFLFFIELNDFKQFNFSQGYPKGDTLLISTENLLKDCSQHYPHTVLARLQGGIFAILIPNISLLTAEQIANEICQTAIEVKINLNIGLGETKPQQKIDFLLAETDMALRSAQAHGLNTWIEAKFSSDSIYQASEWKEILLQVLRDKTIVLTYQPTISAKNNSILFYETFLTIPKNDGGLLPAATFYPMILQFELTFQFECLVIEKVIEKLKNATSQEIFIINLSGVDGLQGYLLGRPE